MGRTIPTRRGGLHRWLQSLILTTLGHARYPRPLDRCRTVRAGGGSGLVRGRGGLPATAGAGARGMGSCGTAGPAYRHPDGISEARARPRSEEHTSELQSLMRNSYAVL